MSEGFMNNTFAGMHDDRLFMSMSSKFCKYCKDLISCSLRRFHDCFYCPTARFFQTKYESNAANADSYDPPSLLVLR
ncbi:hypothetical protein E4U41_001694, partial [Claviceps citrina]